MRRLAILAGLSLAIPPVGVSAGPHRQEESEERSLAGGGAGLRLDAGAGHTITVRHADGELQLVCLKGDTHQAVAGLESLLREAEADRVAWSEPASSRAPAVPVGATIGFDPRSRAGTDDAGWPLLYTPGALQPGSTRSHFDTRAFPNLLMEPAINADLPLRGVDLADETLRDLGWRAGRFRTELRFTDPEGVGFRHAVLGRARRAALGAAARIWGRRLGSRAPVVVEASFADLPCDPSFGAVLAGASPTFVFRGFPGGLAETWYPGAIAESITGEDLTGPDEPDLFILFNGALDEDCLGAGTGWHYGTTEGAPPGRIPFVTVALHELGHGLGFTGLADVQTGELFLGLPDIFTRRMLDNRLDATWDEMGNAQRRRSAVREGGVVLTTPRGRRAARRTLDGSVVLTIEAPATVAGIHRVGVARFGPRVEGAPIAGDLALVDDGTATPRAACSPLVNGAAIAGKVAVVARGDCTFTVKVAHAQAAGAIGVIVVNNVPGAPFDMGGSDDTIAIPSVMVGRSLGAGLREALR